MPLNYILEVEAFDVWSINRAFALFKRE